MGGQVTLAEGIREAQRVHEGFASEPEAAAYWAKGADWVPTEDRTYKGAAGQEQAARLYRGGGRGPVVLYVHGGGWAGGSIALNERACQVLARDAGCDVVSVSYRLAPAHPYPAGLEDCRAALAAFRTAFPGRAFALAGASAGANLALALALDEEAAGLVLFYGVYGNDLTTGSYTSFATGYGFTRDRMAELFQLYDPEGWRDSDPRICPLRAGDDQLRRLPPACLVAAGLDVLRDDTLALARRLAALDAPHLLEVEPGVTHGFINRGRHVPAADACLSRAARFLSELEPT